MTTDVLNAQSAKHLRKQQALRLKEMREQERQNALLQTRLFRGTVVQLQLKEQLKHEAYLQLQRTEELLLLEGAVEAHVHSLGQAQRDAITVARLAEQKRVQLEAEQKLFNKKQQERHIQAVKQARMQQLLAKEKVITHQLRKQHILAVERKKAQHFNLLQTQQQEERILAQAATKAAAAEARYSRPLQMDFKNTRIHEQFATTTPSPHLPAVPDVPNPLEQARQTSATSQQAAARRQQQEQEAHARAQERYQAAQAKIRADKYAARLEAELAALEAEKTRTRQAQLMSHRLRLADRRAQEEVTKAFEDNFLVPAPPAGRQGASTSAITGTAQQQAGESAGFNQFATLPKWSTSRAGLGRGGVSIDMAQQDDFTFPVFSSAVQHLPPLPLFPPSMQQQQPSLPAHLQPGEQLPLSAPLQQPIQQADTIDTAAVHEDDGPAASHQAAHQVQQIENSNIQETAHQHQAQQDVSLNARDQQPRPDMSSHTSSAAVATQQPASANQPGIRVIGEQPVSLQEQLHDQASQSQKNEQEQQTDPIDVTLRTVTNPQGLQLNGVGTEAVHDGASSDVTDSDSGSDDGDRVDDVLESVLDQELAAMRHQLGMQARNDHARAQELRQGSRSRASKAYEPREAQQPTSTLIHQPFTTTSIPSTPDHVISTPASSVTSPWSLDLRLSPGEAAMLEQLRAAGRADLQGDGWAGLLQGDDADELALDLLDESASSISSVSMSSIQDLVARGVLPAEVAAALLPPTAKLPTTQAPRPSRAQAPTALADVPHMSATATSITTVSSAVAAINSTSLPTYTTTTASITTVPSSLNSSAIARRITSLSDHAVATAGDSSQSAVPDRSSYTYSSGIPSLQHSSALTSHVPAAVPATGLSRGQGSATISQSALSMNYISSLANQPVSSPATSTTTLGTDLLQLDFSNSASSVMRYPAATGVTNLHELARRRPSVQTQPQQAADVPSQASSTRPAADVPASNASTVSGPSSSSASSYDVFSKASTDTGLSSALSALLSSSTLTSIVDPGMLLSTLSNSEAEYNSGSGGVGINTGTATTSGATAMGTVVQPIVNPERYSQQPTIPLSSAQACSDRSSPASLHTDAAHSEIQPAVSSSLSPLTSSPQLLASVPLQTMLALQDLDLDSMTIGEILALQLPTLSPSAVDTLERMSGEGGAVNEFEKRLGASLQEDAADHVQGYMQDTQQLEPHSSSSHSIVGRAGDLLFGLRQAGILHTIQEEQEEVEGSETSSLFGTKSPTPSLMHSSLAATRLSGSLSTQLDFLSQHEHQPGIGMQASSSEQSSGSLQAPQQPTNLEHAFNEVVEGHATLTDASESSWMPTRHAGNAGSNAISYGSSTDNLDDPEHFSTIMSRLLDEIGRGLAAVDMTGSHTQVRSNQMLDSCQRKVNKLTSLATTLRAVSSYSGKAHEQHNAMH